jgi:flagellar export protein FliJ
MNKAVRLEPLADYAGKVEAEAARRLATSVKALAAKQREVEQLRSYLAEYRQRAELADGTTDALRWQNARAFLAKLGALVTARETELDQAVVAHRLETERWRDSHRRSKSLDKIVEQAERQVLADLAKREQRELDELTLSRMLGRH